MVIVPYVNKDKKHFPDISKQLGIEYEDMMFFDDEQLQYRVVSLTSNRGQPPCPEMHCALSARRQQRNSDACRLVILV